MEDGKLGIGNMQNIKLMRLIYILVYKKKIKLKIIIMKAIFIIIKQIKKLIILKNY